MAFNDDVKIKFDIDWRRAGTEFAQGLNSIQKINNSGGSYGSGGSDYKRFALLSKETTNGTAFTQHGTKQASFDKNTYSHYGYASSDGARFIRNRIKELDEDERISVANGTPVDHSQERSFINKRIAYNNFSGLGKKFYNSAFASNLKDTTALTIAGGISKLNPIAAGLGVGLAVNQTIGDPIGIGNMFSGMANYFHPKVDSTNMNFSPNLIGSYNIGDYTFNVGISSPYYPDFILMDKFLSWNGIPVSDIEVPDLNPENYKEKTHTFIKCNGANVKSSVKRASMQFSSMLNNGVRLWKGKIAVGDET